jgi:hypothetical protein
VKEKKMQLWAAVWDGVVFRDGREGKQLKLFTVARTKREAVDTMRDGLMGLTGCEGSHVKPTRVWQVSALTADAKKGYALWLMRNDGFRFIAPYDAMTDQDVAGLVHRLVSR